MIFPSAHLKPANRSPEYFSMVSPSSSRHVHKDLYVRPVLSLLFRTIALENIHFSPKNLSSRIRGIVRVNGNDAWIYAQEESETVLKTLKRASQSI